MGRCLRLKVTALETLLSANDVKFYPAKDHRPVRRVHLIDTAIASDNAGDEIILGEARRQLAPYFEDALITTSSGHDGLGENGRKFVSQADIVLLLGTNALASWYRRSPRFMWALRRKDVPVLAGKVILVGVGANRDFKRVETRQKRLLARLLSDKYVHSVRDDLGAQIVTAAGRKVINTSCPTLWSAPKPEDIPRDKANDVVLTLTHHKPDPADALLLRDLNSLYNSVWFWPQQIEDLGYLRQLEGHENVRVLAPNLSEYDAFLRGSHTDVVGTRLHGTIRGLHHRRRCLVVAIDNRARDIGRETGLPVIARADVASGLSAYLTKPYDTRITPPIDKITEFLAQFRV